VTLLAPIFLALAGTAAVVIVLHLLRERSRPYPVSTLHLWEALPRDPSSRTTMLRKRFGLLLLLQLLVVAFLAVALAQPAWLRPQPRAASAILVLDVSASMRAGSDGTGSVLERARTEALRWLERGTGEVAVVAFARRSQVVLPLTSDRDAVRQAIGTLQPTWMGDGGVAALRATIRGISDAAIDEVVVFSDREVVLDDTVATRSHVHVVPRAENVAIVAFHVRQQNDTGRVEAFLRVRNQTAARWDGAVRIVGAGGAHEAVAELSIDALDEVETRLSLGATDAVSFTASLAPGDRFPEDDIRYAALPRPVEYLVHWIGPRNRFLAAALQASPRRQVSIAYLDDPFGVAGDLVSTPGSSPDLLVAHGTTLPASASGRILLVHAGLSGALRLSAPAEGGAIRMRAAHALLDGVDPAALRVAELPGVELGVEATWLLEVGDRPLLLTWHEASRDVVAWTASLERSNLGITVDLPLLIDNILDGFGRAPSWDRFRWSEVGEVVPLSGYGAVRRIDDERGEPVMGEAAPEGFVPERPGVYWVQAAGGRYPVAVNVPLTESGIEPLGDTPVVDRSIALPTAVPQPLWRWFIALALAALLVEAGWYHRRSLRRRR
jgi:hypothetical protein